MFSTVGHDNIFRFELNIEFSDLSSCQEIPRRHQRDIYHFMMRVKTLFLLIFFLEKIKDMIPNVVEEACKDSKRSYFATIFFKHPKYLAITILKLLETFHRLWQIFYNHLKSVFSLFLINLVDCLHLPFRT